jgi:hypothetical protein
MKHLNGTKLLLIMSREFLAMVDVAKLRRSAKWEFEINI